MEHPLTCPNCGYVTTFVEWREGELFDQNLEYDIIHDPDNYEWEYVTICMNPACKTGEIRTLLTFNGQFGKPKKEI